MFDLPAALAYVREFHQAFSIPTWHNFTRPGPSTVLLRQRLLEEEVAELLEGLDRADLVNVAGELADVVVIICGTALTFGVPLAFSEHPVALKDPQAALSKLPALYAQAVGSGDADAITRALSFGLDALAVLARELDVPLDACLKEVHRANMSKLGPDGKPVYRADGKVLKGPDFAPADIESVLVAHGRL